MQKRSNAVTLKAIGPLLERLSKIKGAGRYLTVPGLRMAGADVSAAGKLFGGTAKTADPSKYAVWLNRVLNNGKSTADLLVDKNIPLLHNPSFIVDRLGRTGWSASPDALRAAGVVQVNAAPLRSLDGGPFVATPAELQAFENGIFPFRSMYGRLFAGKNAAGKPIYIPWRVSNHVNTVVPVREITGASGTGRYYDVMRNATAGVDPRLTTSKQFSRGSFDLFVPEGSETGIRFDWQEPYGLPGFYGGPRMGGPRDWGGVARDYGLKKTSEEAKAMAGRAVPNRYELLYKAAAAKDDFANMVRAYKDRYGIDLSHMRLAMSKHPRYSNGKRSYELADDETGGSWGKDNVVYLNPNARAVIRRWGLDVKPGEFRRRIIAHELGHEVYRKGLARDLVRQMLAQARKDKFNTVYLDTVPARKKREETFAEYVSAQLNKKADGGAVSNAVPRVGFKLVGYDKATQPEGTYGRGGFNAASSGLKLLRNATPDTTKAQLVSAKAVPAVQASGQYAVDAVNTLANMPEFQRRAGNGDQAVGLKRVQTAAADLAELPFVNEVPSVGSAVAHTRNGAESWVSLPATAATAHKTYRRTGKWLDGLMTHEAFHPFTIKLPGYIGKIEQIQREEGLPDTKSYHYTPREQAAEMNALRALKGAWPGKGAGPNGEYTPEQADAILDGRNPYFKGLPTKYKMRLLNEARNKRQVQRPYGAVRRATV